MCSSIDPLPLISEKSCPVLDDVSLIQDPASNKSNIVKLQVLGLRLGVDFTFTLDNNDNNNDKNDNNPHLNFFKGTVLGVKKQGLGIRHKA